MSPDELAAVPAGTPDEDGWEQPVALTSVDLPPFPRDVLPGWVGEHAAAVAHALQVPYELPAMLILSAISAAISKKVEIELKDNYREPLNIWTVTPLRPGNRKSAVVREIKAPIYDWQRSEAERLRDEIARAASLKRIREGSLVKTERAASGAKELNEQLKLESDARDLAVELSHLTVPVSPRLLADDVTSERLATLLMEQGGRMAIISPEGDIFDLMAGKYNNNIPNIGVYLRGHAGDTIEVDRTGRPADFIEAPALVLGISPQPSVLVGLIDKPGFRGRGLLGRFLYSLPRSFVGRRNLEAPPLSDAARDQYARHLRALLDIEMPDAPRILVLTSDAYRLWRAFEAELEPQLDPDAELGAIDDWASKLAGAAGRLAGVLHVGIHAPRGGGLDRAVAGDTMAAAVALARYCIPHARQAFIQMGEDIAPVDDASHILTWIERIGQARFTRRDVWQSLRRRFNVVDDLNAPLRRLCDHGYIRPASDSAKSPHTYDVNPLFLESARKRTQRTQQDGDDPSSVYVVYASEPSEPSKNGHAPAPAGILAGSEGEWEVF